VVGAADDAAGTSDGLLRGAAEIGTQSETLRMEVDQFLVAVRSETGERRRYQRVPGHGATVTLRAPERQPARVLLINLSRGGAALACDWSIAVGAAVTVGLPDDGGEVPARIARRQGGAVGIVFRQDAETLALLDRLVDGLAGEQAAA
jgi:methyl-accepting chemotaxis protein